MINFADPGTAQDQNTDKAETLQYGQYTLIKQGGMSQMEAQDTCESLGYIGLASINHPGEFSNIKDAFTNFTVHEAWLARSVIPEHGALTKDGMWTFLEC